MTHSDRIEALRALRYTPREATFLELVAVHSGYFLRRQFNAYIGGKRGGLVAALVEKLFFRRHACVTKTRDRTLIYHLLAKRLYVALGQADNRHRRKRPASGIKAKLMALDYVLAHAGERFLATEAERVDYFTGLGFERARLPRTLYRARAGGPPTIRYFVERYPTWVREIAGVPVVSFTYVDPGGASMEGFETFLRSYNWLAEALPQMRIVYVADRERSFDAARETFDAWRKASSDRANDQRDAAYMTRLFEYFQLEHWYELRQFDRLLKSGLDRLRDGRQTFHGEDVKRLYGVWKTAGPAAVRDWLERTIAFGPERSVTFSTFLVEHDFGFMRLFEEDEVV